MQCALAISETEAELKTFEIPHSIDCIQVIDEHLPLEWGMIARLLLHKIIIVDIISELQPGFEHITS